MEYNSVYDIRLKMLEKMGGDVTRKYDSIYSIDLEILRLLEEGGGGGEKTYDYLTFTALEPSTITYRPAESEITTAQYSYDKVNWKTADNVQLSLNKNDKVYFKGEIKGETDGMMMMGASFSIGGKVSASGSIMSLQAGDPNDKTINYKNAFNGLFSYCSSLTTAPELPATTLTEGCYSNMFANCKSLITAPELPATTLATECYREMFQSCESLTTVQELPATTLADNCYSNMFLSCISLVTVPAILPATTLANNCYSSMFNYCTSLTTAPELPATTLANSCYSNMFVNCKALTTAPALPATTLATYCYDSMFQGCIELTTAPVLPATTLVNNCYSNMFSSCSKLNYIKALFTTTPDNTYTSSWLYKVASTGTFVKNSEATWNLTGTSGIPEGWTVETA